MPHYVPTARFHVCPHRELLLPRAHGPSCLMLASSFPSHFPSCGSNLRPPIQSQVQPSYLSCSVTGSSLYCPVRDYWGGFFTAHWSTECPYLDFNLIWGLRTQHLYTEGRIDPNSTVQSPQVRAPCKRQCQSRAFTMSEAQRARGTVVM